MQCFPHRADDAHLLLEGNVCSAQLTDACKSPADCFAGLHISLKSGPVTASVDDTTTPASPPEDLVTSKLEPAGKTRTPPACVQNKACLVLHCPSIVPLMIVAVADMYSCILYWIHIRLAALVTATRLLLHVMAYLEHCYSSAAATCSAIQCLGQLLTVRNRFTEVQRLVLCVPGTSRFHTCVMVVLCTQVCTATAALFLHLTWLPCVCRWEEQTCTGEDGVFTNLYACSHRLCSNPFFFPNSAAGTAGQARSPGH